MENVLVESDGYHKYSQENYDPIRISPTAAMLIGRLVATLQIYLFFSCFCPRLAHLFPVLDPMDSARAAMLYALLSSVAATLGHFFCPRAGTTLLL
jgi:hypothetical protein